MRLAAALFLLLAGCTENVTNPQPRMECIASGAPVYPGRGGGEHPTCHRWGLRCPDPLELREERVPAPGLYVNVPKEERSIEVRMTCRLPNQK
jgi:hypothetical protein